MSIDWENWSPGNRGAAELAAKTDWLENGITKQRILFEGSKEIDLNSFAAIVAEEIALGSSESKIVKRIRNEMAVEKELAKSIVHFATTLAISEDSLARYLESGIEYVEWLGGSCCPACDENDGTKVKIGKKFNSGHAIPPACGYCICSISPYFAQ